MNCIFTGFPASFENSWSNSAKCRWVPPIAYGCEPSESSECNNPSFNVRPAPLTPVFKSIMISSKLIKFSFIIGRNAYWPAAALQPVPATSRADLIESL